MDATTLPFQPSLRLRPETDVTQESERAQMTGQDREIGPDLVRCIACILVVGLHASVPYLVHPMPGLVWVVNDSPSPTVDGIFWAIEVFVMPLFLLLSGFYGWNALKKDSSRQYLHSRVKRLLRPLLFGVLVILPIDLYLWTFGLIVQGHFSLVKLRSLKIPSPWGDQIWGLSHLWYLLYVFLYAAVLWCGYRWLQHSRRSTGPVQQRVKSLIDWLLQPIHAAILLVITAVCTLAMAPEVVYGFQHAFWPVPSKWIYSGTFFAGGVLLATVDAQWQRTARGTQLHGMLGLCGLVAAVVLGTWRLQLIKEQGTSNLAVAEWSLAAVTVFAAWTITLGTVGWSIRLGTRLQMSDSRSAGFIRRSIQYFAAASFWIYLIHHPLVGLVQLDLYVLQTPLHAATKSLIATTLACLIGTLTYRWWFHETRMGAWLGLSSYKPTPRIADDQPATIAMPQMEANKRRAA